MRLNLGCGRNRVEGAINVDRERLLSPDRLVDLEELPWPWPDGAADEILMTHVLEHLGQTPSQFCGIIKEIYRVLKPGGKLRVTVPHPRSDNFLADPTHVRPILPMTMRMLSRRECIRQRDGAMTPLALLLDVNFEFASDIVYGYSAIGMSIAEAQREHAAEMMNNIATEITMVLRRI